MRGFHPPNALRDSRRREFARALLLPRGCADGGECGGRGNAAALPGGRCAGQTGRLGHNDEQNKLAPARLGREQFGGGQIVFVAAGGMHTVALAEGGVLWAWGRGIRGQLGLGDRGSRLGANAAGGGGGVWRVNTHGRCSILWVYTLPACGCHTLVATEQGEVWAFGRGAHGQLGSNDKNDRLVPTRVVARRAADLFLHFATVAAGSEHSAAVTEGGALFTLGRGEAVDAGSQVPGGLGHTSRDDRLVPTLVSPSLLGVSVYTSTDVKEFKVGKAGGSGFVRVRVCPSTSLPFPSTVSSTASIFAMA